MTALMVALINDISDDWRAEYLANVPAILAKYGGKAVVRSGPISQVEGGEVEMPDRISVIAFPDEDAGRAFLADPSYAPYHKLRKDGARSEIFLFENTLGSFLGV